ncbi:MAG: transposase [Terracidiphilus sp.]
MDLKQMLEELPRQCSIGVKTSSKGHRQYWRGYKLHLDVGDGQIPISAVLTGASVHDSQVAIPLAAMSAARVQYCYELMDSAYDAVEILEHSREAGHVPIVDPANRGRKKKQKKGESSPDKAPRELSWAQSDRFRERTMVERVYARLKEEFGGRYVRVRGAGKVMTHLMFGVLALTADQILRLEPEGS